MIPYNYSLRKGLCNFFVAIIQMKIFIMFAVLRRNV